MAKKEKDKSEMTEQELEQKRKDDYLEYLAEQQKKGIGLPPSNAEVYAFNLMNNLYD